MVNARECPTCGARSMTKFYEQQSVPANSCILLERYEEAIGYPRGDVELCFCSECGFISNMAFDSKLTEYSGRYEETQGFSSTFNKFHLDLAERLISRYDLHDKDVLEIGCGKGEFITLLSEIGNNRGIGFDPGYKSDRVVSKTARRNVKFIADFYSEKYTAYHSDFVCCKMTLEHIHSTEKFLSTVRKSIGDRAETVVFFQVPETTRILKECAFEDIYYEHCSYFTPVSLVHLFQRCEFDVLNVETEYDDQYLTIEARPRIEGCDASISSSVEKKDIETLKKLVESFPDRYQKIYQDWKDRLQMFKDSGKKVVLWGSGSKGVSFLTTLKPENLIKYVVDINPYRQGFYMPGSGQKIVSPEFLQEYHPDVVIIMNAIYREEIQQSLKELGISADVIAI